MTSKPNRKLILTGGAVCFFLVFSVSVGCRINLPAQTHSNLWARAVEDRADWHLCNMQQAPNPTHKTKAMSDWTKGYYRGYHDAAFSVNQLPASQYPAVWSDQRNKHNSDEQAIQAGYSAGFEQASSDGLISSAQPRR